MRVMTRGRASRGKLSGRNSEHRTAAASVARGATPAATTGGAGASGNVANRGRSQQIARPPAASCAKTTPAETPRDQERLDRLNARIGKLEAIVAQFVGSSGSGDDASAPVTNRPSAQQRSKRRKRVLPTPPTLFLRVHDVSFYLLWKKSAAVTTTSNSASAAAAAAATATAAEEAANKDDTKGELPAVHSEDDNSLADDARATGALGEKSPSLPPGTVTLQDVIELLEEPANIALCSRLAGVLRNPAITVRTIRKKQSVDVWWLACSVPEDDQATAAALRECCAELEPGLVVECGRFPAMRSPLGLFFTEAGPGPPLKTRNDCAHAWIASGRARDFREQHSDIRVLNTGMLVYSRDTVTGELVVLVFDDKHGQASCHTGGGLDPILDGSVIDGAVREFHEETCGVWKTATVGAWVQQKPPHQFKRVVNQGATFALFVPFVSAAEIAQIVGARSTKDPSEQFERGLEYRELDNFRWIPASELATVMSKVDNRLFDLNQAETLAFLSSLDIQAITDEFARISGGGHHSGGDEEEDANN